MHLSLALASLSLLAAAVGVPNGRRYPAADNTLLSSATTPPTTEATLATTTTTSSVSCDLRYCSNGTSYCHYWGGFTSFDMTLNRPVPGETFKILGPCTRSTVVAATTRTASETETKETKETALRRRYHEKLTIPLTGTSTSTVEGSSATRADYE